MPTLGNTPNRQVVLRLAARKSFALGLWIRNSKGHPLDISNTLFRIVAKKPPFDTDDISDSDNLFVANASSVMTGSLDIGYTRFELQASDLDHKPGEYPFVIVMEDEGYTSVIVDGVIDILPNAEIGSVDSAYTGVSPAQSLQVIMRGQTSIRVEVGGVLAPGTQSFLDADKAKLDTIEEGAQVNIQANWQAPLDDPAAILNKPTPQDLVPPGGSPGAVLTKVSASNGDIAWAQPTGGGGGGGAGLDATGVPDGYVPTANGGGTWDWEDVDGGFSSVNTQTGDVILTADNIPDGVTNVTMTLAEREQLADSTNEPEWEDVQNKPAFGTAALEAEDAYLRPGEIAGEDITSGTVNNLRIPKVSALRGITSGTLPPSGGADGDLYFQYTL